MAADICPELSFCRFMEATVRAAETFKDQGGDFEALFKQICDNYEEGRKYKSPLAGWVGGKFHLARRIVELIPEHKIYVEPFCGSAAVFFRKAKSKAEILNDLQSEVINFFEVIRDDLEGFLRMGRFALASRELFKRHLKENPKASKAAGAWRLAYLIKCAYGGDYEAKSPTFATKGHDYTPAISGLFQTVRWAHQRLSGAILENMPAFMLIKRRDSERTFFYCDPPYPEADKYYATKFTVSDHIELAQTLREVRGKFLISLPDSPFARTLYKGFSFLPVETLYSLKTGNGTKKNVTVPRERELLIANYDLPKLF